MSSPLTVKRRRLNESANTLAKPFVSPLKTAKSGRVPLKQNHNAANVAYQPSMLAHTITAVPPASPEKSSATPKASYSTLTRPKTIRNFPTAVNKKSDPADVAAQKALTALELRTCTARNEIDALKQAAQISSTTTDTDLENLVQKWKLASQTVAEELFGTVKERVYRMGGVAAWRESEKRKYEHSNYLGDFAEQKKQEEDDDADCEFDSQGEELPEEEVEFRKKEKRRVMKEMRDAADFGDEAVAGAEAEVGGKKQVWEQDGRDDDVS